MPLEHPVRVARWIHKRYQFSGPPVSFAPVLADYPIEVDLRDWPLDVSGICVRAALLSSIGLNQNDSLGRRHFTLWHEFYHYLVHDDEWQFYCIRPWERQQRERECNIFAAHVLMPQEWVVELKGPLWLAARRLGVSVQALSVRHDELGIRTLK